MYPFHPRHGETVLVRKRFTYRGTELVPRHSDFDWLKSGGSSRGNSLCSTRTTRERG
jgi:hypothetical protein